MKQGFVCQKIYSSVVFLIMLSFAAFCTAGPENYEHLRERMVQEQIVARGVSDERVLDAMKKVPRHLFVPKQYRDSAYDDYPLPIGKGQTISQPYIVAFMTEVLDPEPDQNVLEIGTGSGYQAAVLAELYQDVYTVEIIEPLARRAKEQLLALGYDNVHVKVGDGYQGWPEKAPFDALIVTCAPEDIPQSLIDQLGEGGRLIIPVGSQYGVQKLVLLVKHNDRLERKELMGVLFVPMVRGK